MTVFKLFHRLHQRRAWDFSGIADKERRKVLQGALDACDYPFYRIRKRTGKRVPCTVADLSRFAAQLDANGHGHVHRHIDLEDLTKHGHETEHGHLLGGPNVYDIGAVPTPGEARRAVLGLYWLPTRAYPAGRVEIHDDCFLAPDLAREVFLAESAHAVDYGAMTDEQRAQIAAAYHDEPDEQGHVSDWFEESGEQDYWNWAGESFMEGFTQAFAPSLPTPLADRQQFTHETTPEIAARIREILL
ncbi:MAG TPA: hypothetical protein VN213_13600 [Solirubrobacteraceae bacterium]|nr:hypothetical protein [Solirubrobacteraceae bacterium]